MGAKKIFAIAVGVLLAVSLILRGAFSWEQQIVFFDLCMILAVTGIVFAGISIQKENGTKTCIITVVALGLALAATIGIVLFFAKITGTSHFSAFELLIVGMLGGLFFDWAAKKIAKTPDEDDSSQNDTNNGSNADAKDGSNADANGGSNADANGGSNADAKDGSNADAKDGSKKT